MFPRLSFKPDSSFFRKLAIGAVGSRAVCKDLESKGHRIFELENGSTDTKIWKDVKRKRVRIPDLICSKCGLRIESRAKTKPDLAMSHSSTDAVRAWDYGMVDKDVIAFPICNAEIEKDWNRGQLVNDYSYWHSQNRIKWEIFEYINYISVENFRKVFHTRTATKGVTEGSETSIVWDAIFSSRDGVVEEIDDGRISIRRFSDSHSYTWQNKKHLPVAVGVNQEIKEVQIIASVVQPLNNQELKCTNVLHENRIIDLIKSPERTQRYTGVKLARLREDSKFEDIVYDLVKHPDEDIYVKMEGAIYLAKICKKSAREQIGSYLDNGDEQIKLESIVALAEAGTDEAVIMLSEVLNNQNNPYFLQSAAAWALGRIGTDGAIQILIKAFSEVEQSVKEDALAAVNEIGKPAVDYFVSGLFNSNEAIAAGSAEALRRQMVLPEEVIKMIVSGVEKNQDRIWAVWLLGNLYKENEFIKSEVSKLQDSDPKVHFAISVLWSFVESWIAKHWELNPLPGE